MIETYVTMRQCLPDDDPFIEELRALILKYCCVECNHIVPGTKHIGFDIKYQDQVGEEFDPHSVTSYVKVKPPTYDWKFCITFTSLDLTCHKKTSEGERYEKTDN